MVERLRKGFGLRHPTGRRPLTDKEAAARLRVREGFRAAAEALRAPLMELAQAGWRDRAIAAEFTRRDLRKYGRYASWDQVKIRNLRHKLGIPSVSGPSIRSVVQAPADEVDQ